MDELDRVRQAVVDALTPPMDSSGRDEAMKKAEPGGGVAYTSRGGDGADPRSIRFLKARQVHRQCVIAAEWVDGEGRAKQGVFSVVRGDDGSWHKTGAHSSSRGGAPLRGRPWVNVGAGGDPFYVGGVVLECPGAALVRLVLEDGLVLEDVPDERGVVLFPSGRPPTQDWSFSDARAEIVADDGELIARHTLFGRLEQP